MLDFNMDSVNNRPSNLFFDLPEELQCKIYGYDLTYHRIWNDIIRNDNYDYYDFIQHRNSPWTSTDYCIHKHYAWLCPSRECRRCFYEREYDRMCEEEREESLRLDRLYERRYGWYG